MVLREPRCTITKDYMTIKTAEEKTRSHGRRNLGVSSGSKEQKGGRKRIKHFFSQRVIGTLITVDSFKVAMSGLGSTTFCVTNFHNGHYGSLSKKRFPAGTRVVCTAATSRLVPDKLEIPDSIIRVLPVWKKVDFVETERLPS